MSASGQTPKASENDADFLAQEAENARIAMRQSLNDLKASLARGVDIRLWAREHPVATAGIAVALGFAAAEAAIPSKRQQELKRWIAIERAAAAVKGEGQEKATRPAEPGFLSTLGKEAIAALRPVLIGMATSAVSAYGQSDEKNNGYDSRTQPPPPEDSTGL